MKKINLISILLLFIYNSIYSYSYNTNLTDTIIKYKTQKIGKRVIIKKEVEIIEKQTEYDTIRYMPSRKEFLNINSLDNSLGNKDFIDNLSKIIYNKNSISVYFTPDGLFPKSNFEINTEYKYGMLSIDYVNAKYSSNYYAFGFLYDIKREKYRFSAGLGMFIFREKAEYSIQKEDYLTGSFNNKSGKQYKQSNFLNIPISAGYFLLNSNRFKISAGGELIYSQLLNETSKAKTVMELVDNGSNIDKDLKNFDKYNFFANIGLGLHYSIFE